MLPYVKMSVFFFFFFFLRSVLNKRKRLVFSHTPMFTTMGMGLRMGKCNIVAIKMSEKRENNCLAIKSTTQLFLHTRQKLPHFLPG